MRWRFVHIPRTGGSSLTTALGRQGTEPGAPHTPAHAFSPEVRLFSILRDPFDRAVSICAYLCATYGRRLSPADFRDWVRLGCPPSITDEPRGVHINGWRSPHGLHIASEQRAWLDGRSSVELLRHDRLQAELVRIARELEIEPRRLPHVNASARHRSVQAYYDKPTRDLVHSLYSCDVELWRSLTDRGDRHA